MGIIGAGHIGGGIAHQLAAAGHEVSSLSPVSSRSLERLAAEIGPARLGSPAEAVATARSWSSRSRGSVMRAAVGGRAAGGKVIVIDTMQPVRRRRAHPGAGETAAQFNAGADAGRRYTKSFNTLTSAFQRQTATGAASRRVVQWLCGDDAEAKPVVVGRLITDAGFVPVDLGGTADCAVMEAPRRRGAVYGEEYPRRRCAAVVEAVLGKGSDSSRRSSTGASQTTYQAHHRRRLDPQLAPAPCVDHGTVRWKPGRCPCVPGPNGRSAREAHHGPHRRGA